MTKIKTQRFDAADYLDSPETIAAYLTEALDTGDPEYVVQAIGTVARAQGMKHVAMDAGVSREHLYRALDAGGNPGFGNVMKVLDALGVHLEARPNAA
jgi:probable addiction module antidote protein